MQPSASEEIARFEGSSPLVDPVEALRAALFEAQRGMAAAGFGPPHAIRQVWQGADIAALDPALMPVDLAYREVFTGFRREIRRETAEGPGIRVIVECRKPAPAPDAEAIGALERAYSARRGVDMEAVLGQWRREGAEARAALEASGQARLDLAFGPGPYERLDLFVPAMQGPHPLWVFLHGGYWMATDKAQYAQFAGGMLAAGFAVAVPNYALAPEASVARQVAESCAALQFLDREADRLALKRGDFHLAGHSAGAHLAAMVASEPGAVPLRSLLLLSGLFDIGALGPTALGRLIGFSDAATARALSPLNRPRPAATRIFHALGALEASGFFDEARKLEAGWNVPPSLAIENANHFNLLEGLKSGRLLDAAIEIAR